MPHPYSTLTDIQSVLPELTDARLGTGNFPTSAQVAAWIGEADEIIDGHLATIQPRSFTLPLATLPTVITGISRDLAAGRIRNAIYKDRPRGDLVDDDLWNRAMKLLQSLTSEAQLYPGSDATAHASDNLASWVNGDQKIKWGEDQW